MLMSHKVEHRPQSPEIALPQHQSCLCVHAQLLKAGRLQQRHAVRQQGAQTALQRLLPQPPELGLLRLFHNVLQNDRQVRSGCLPCDSVMFPNHVHALNSVLLADLSECFTVALTQTSRVVGM